ncbi:LytTR family DNA-binding domain-containing protein [Phenylobacterium kunshanense]|uniref:LytTR family DNA-binding domain-containing protein n=1 Tax=Phenylobacterium kunshanense TaxID=1445034 RepID=UPI001402D815|nr:LytTR family DNA-binding domain-containing protein [Phenylobacterium kunshanense]
MTSGRRDDLLFVAIAAVTGLAVTVFNTLNVVDDRARVGRPIPVWEPAVWEGTSVIVLLCLLPVVMWATRRAWPSRAAVVQLAAIHLATFLAIFLVHVTVMGLLRSAIYGLAGATYEPLQPLRDWPYELRQDLPIYVAVVLFYVAWTKLRRSGGTTAAPDRNRLEVRDGARRIYVPVDEIDWIEAAGNYVELHRAAGSLLHRSSLAEMERQLAGRDFVRIHRSRLVRRSAVRQVETKPSGDFVVRLSRGGELAGSRRYRRPLLEP